MFDDDQADEHEWDEYDPAPPEPDYELPELLADLTAPWRQQAACRDQPTEWWFPDYRTGFGDAHPRAKRICAACPVREDCLTAGLVELHGYWGGESMRSRARIAQHRRIDAQRAARGLT